MREDKFYQDWAEDLTDGEKEILKFIGAAAEPVHRTEVHNHIYRLAIAGADVYPADLKEFEDYKNGNFWNLEVAWIIESIENEGLVERQRGKDGKFMKTTPLKLSEEGKHLLSFMNVAEAEE